MHPRKNAGRGARLLMAAAALLLLRCAPAPLTPLELETGPGAEISVEGLHRAKNSIYRQVWVKPDADFASYDKVALDPVSISYKRTPRRNDLGRSRGDFALSDQQMSNLERLFREEFVKELSGNECYELVDEDGPTVLRVAAQIIDLVVNVPTRPQPGRGDVYTTSTGEMTLLMELHDSQSGEILARVADRREARAAGHGGGSSLYHSNSVTDTDAARRVFRRWAHILRLRLDHVHGAGEGEGREGGQREGGRC